MDFTKEKKKVAQELVKKSAALLVVICGDPQAIDDGNVRKMILCCSRALECAGSWKAKSLLELQRMNIPLQEWTIEKETL